MNQFVYLYCWSIILLATWSLYSVAVHAQAHSHPHDTTVYPSHHHVPVARTAAQDTRVAVFVERARAATARYHDLSAADCAAIQQVLKRFHDQMQTRYRILRDVGAVTDADVAWLVAQWHALWATLRAAVRPALWAEIKMLAG